jgi:glyoxylase-like metal-dependent hydrolase (beta-lactamase superfamily II)
MANESLAELVRFVPDVYGFRWANHVALFIVTDAGVILVDANGQVNPRTPSLLKEAIRSVTTQPVRYLVYSHSAFDHSTGGAVFSDTARFVGHKNTVDRIKAANDPTTPVPDIVFDKKTTLELGGRVVDLYPADLSPTDDYIVVHYPAGRVAMFVDLVQPRNVPFRTLLGHPERIVERLQWLEDKLDFDIIVSGHATPQMSGTKQDVAEQRVLPRPLGCDRDRALGRPRRRLGRDDDPGWQHPASEVRRVAALRRVPAAEHPGHDRLARWQIAFGALSGLEATARGVGALSGWGRQPCRPWIWS